MYAGCMAALQAEHFITAHAAADAPAAAVPAEAATANGALANGSPAPAAAAAGNPNPGAGPGAAHLTASEKAAIDKEADDTPMMAVL